MGCDTVVALGRATVDGHTLFAHNCDRPPRECQVLARLARREYSPGEKVQTQGLELPQVRQTATVLGSRPAGCWGFTHGVNEHAVAVAATSLRTKLAADGAGLFGTDLVRLALERSENARQAVDQLTGLIERYGQAAESDGPCDHGVVRVAPDAHLMIPGFLRQREDPHLCDLSGQLGVKDRAQFPIGRIAEASCRND